jgi:hypothetical protein
MGVAASDTSYSSLRTTIDGKYVRLLDKKRSDTKEANEEDEKQCLKDVHREDFIVNGVCIAGASLLPKLSAMLQHERQVVKTLMQACSRSAHGGEAYSELLKLLPLGGCLLKPATVSCKPTEIDIRFSQPLSTSSNYTPAVEIASFSVFQLLRDEDIDMMDVEDNIESRVGLIIQTVTKNVLRHQAPTLTNQPVHSSGPSCFASVERSLSIAVLAPPGNHGSGIMGLGRRVIVESLGITVAIIFALHQMRDGNYMVSGAVLVALAALAWCEMCDVLKPKFHHWSSVVPAGSGLKPMAVRG